MLNIPLKCYSNNKNTKIPRNKIRILIPKMMLKPTQSMMTTQSTSSSSFSYGKSESWTEYVEIVKKDANISSKKQKSIEEDKWQTRQFYYKIANLAQMQLIITQRQSMFSCRNTITEVLSIRIARMKFLKEITTCLLLCRCKTNHYCPRFCRRELETLVRKGKASILTWQHRIQVTWTHWLGLMKAFFSLGNAKLQDTKDPIVKMYDS